MPTAALIAGGVSAGGGILSSIIGANAQVSAQQKAIQAEQTMFNTGRADQLNLFNQGVTAQDNMFGTAQNTLMPFVNNANNVWGTLAPLIGAQPGGNPLTAPLTKPFDASMLPSTPGYQFTLGQGLKTAQGGFASKGLGSSGTAIKGAEDYATGLAQSTYNQQFQNYLQQNQQIYNLLYGPYATGAGAAGTLASTATQAGGNILNAATGAGGNILGGATTAGGQIAQSTTGIGNAIAGAATGSANALTGGVTLAMLPSILAALKGPGAAAGAGAAPVNPLYPSTSSYYPGGPFQSAWQPGVGA
jgi:hypothetical protein